MLICARIFSLVLVTIGAMVALWVCTLGAISVAVEMADWRGVDLSG